MNASSPSLRLIELTTPLPWTHLSPASITDHLDESMTTGTRLMSGSAAMSWRKVVMASCESSIPSSMLTSSIWAPLSTCCRAISRPASYSPARTSLANLRDPVTLVRSPTFTKMLSGPMARGSNPLSRRRGGGEAGTRGGSPATASAMALMWAGVVPQQPPTRLTSPLSANSWRIPAIYSGLSSYCPNSFGRPALGWVLTNVGATRESSCTYCRSALAPRAQFSPTLSGRPCATEFQKASVV